MFCFVVGVWQCADFGELIQRNKDTASQSTGYDAASRIWTGIEIVAQLDMFGINAERFSVLQVNSKHVLCLFDRSSVCILFELSSSLSK